MWCCSVGLLYQDYLIFHLPVESVDYYGAKIIEGRSQNEFAKESLEGALNLPLEDLGHLVEGFKPGLIFLRVILAAIMGSCYLLFLW